MAAGTLTFTVCVPVRSDGIEAQVPLVRLASEYVVVTVGLTVTGILFKLDGPNAAPFVNVPVKVPDPKRVIGKVADCPRQIVVVSARDANGRGFTVIVNVFGILKHVFAFLTWILPVYVPAGVPAGIGMVIEPDGRAAFVTGAKLFAGVGLHVMLY